ncbi:MAG: hypothetical protein PHW74_06845 [Desulfobacca sp.]|nr:hypothetical protein [Desulfobacca sp.]
MAGLFKKIKNRPTGRRYVISTIRKSPESFETAVFTANFLYWPRSLKHPDLVIHTETIEAACQMHERLVQRLALELPARLFQEYG